MGSSYESTNQLLIRGVTRAMQIADRLGHQKIKKKKKMIRNNRKEIKPDFRKY